MVDMNIYDTLVSFETAKLAKEKGFKIKTMPFYRVIEPMSSDVKYFGKKDKEILVKYNNQFDSDWSDFSAPTQSLLQKWLREKHNIEIVIHPIFYSVTKKEYCADILGNNLQSENSYEEALEKGLQEGLKLIKDKK